MRLSLFIGMSPTSMGCEDEQKTKETKLPGTEMSILIALYCMLKQVADSRELLVVCTLCMYACRI